MLSRLVKVSLVRSFSTATQPVVRSPAGKSLIERSGVSEVELTQSTVNELAEVSAVVESERRHLAYYANEYLIRHTGSSRSSMIASTSTSRLKKTARHSFSKAPLMAQTVINLEKCLFSPQEQDFGTYFSDSPHISPL